MNKKERDSENIYAKIVDMKLTVKVKLQPTREQFERLLATLTEADQCCNALSETAFREKTFKQYAMASG